MGGVQRCQEIDCCGRNNAKNKAQRGEPVGQRDKRSALWSIEFNDQKKGNDLVRMLINYLFWIAVAVLGLAVWTSQLPIYG